MNTQVSKQNDNDFEAFLAELDELIPEPSEEEQARIDEQEREQRKRVMEISHKYKVSEEKLTDLSVLMDNALDYTKSLCSNKEICVAEKRWGYEKDTTLYGYIVNMYKCKSFTRNEIVIELMYEYGKISLFKIDLDKPMISKAFRERFNNVSILRERVEDAMIGLNICNKRMRNGSTYSVVKNIVLFTKDEMNTIFNITDKDIDFYLAAKAIIHRTTERLRKEYAKQMNLRENN